MFNPRSVHGALDHDRSEIVRFDDGRIMYVKKCELVAKRVADRPVFRLAELDPSSVYYGESFVQRWRACNLRGIEFVKVWSSA